MTNTGTYVTQFTAEEVRQLYTLRVELELLALQWAKPRVTDNDLKELTRQIAKSCGSWGEEAIGVNFWNWTTRFIAGAGPSPVTLISPKHWIA